MKIHRILHGLPVIILLSLAVAVVAPSQSLAANVTPLVSFNGTTGVVPEAGLIADAKGNLFGTTTAGGANNGGTAFEIAKTATGYATTPTVLVNFDSTSGVVPEAGLIADDNGNLFGTTTAGGANNGGTVFEIAGSGFAVFAGTPGKANCFGQSVAALARQFGGLNAAAAALGFPTVQALQNAILAFCGG